MSPPDRSAPVRPTTWAFDALLFDMDGVLVFSKEAWYRAFDAYRSMSMAEFEERHWGRDLSANLADLGADASTFCTDYFQPQLDHIERAADADRVLAQLRSEYGCKIGLVTNTTADFTRLILDHVSLTGAFDGIFTASDVDRGKPDPAMIHVACDALGVAPERSVMIGDSDEDMEAGDRAGCRTIGVGDDVANSAAAEVTVEDIRGLPAVLARLSDDEQEGG